MESSALARNLLLAALALIGVFFLVTFTIGYRRLMEKRKDLPTGAPGPLHVVIGFVTNFFDTLGIGSFATTTTMYRAGKMVDDKQLPGTLNVGHAMATVTQALLFTQAVPVETTTLLVMIVAAVLGSYLGAGIVVKLPKRAVQIGMGTALLVFSVFMLASLRGIGPAGGEALGLTGGKLVFAAVANFGLGALMSLGIGLYAPCLLLVSLLGMNPIAAFPIMMSSCAFLMPIASLRFVREGALNPRAALGLLIGGVPAVLIAFYFVKNLDITTLKWIVVAVVLFAALGLLRSAWMSRNAIPEPIPGTASH
jgi:uncharacterized membrane protein YfcA